MPAPAWLFFTGCVPCALRA